jgi:hypothetical protein
MTPLDELVSRFARRRVKAIAIGLLGVVTAAALAVLIFPSVSAFSWIGF